MNLSNHKTLLKWGKKKQKRIDFLDREIRLYEFHKAGSELGDKIIISLLVVAGFVILITIGG